MKGLSSAELEVLEDALIVLDDPPHYHCCHDDPDSAEFLEAVAALVIRGAVVRTDFICECGLPDFVPDITESGRLALHCHELAQR